ncbi:MAG: hypothetical protein V7678_13400 [Brevundimonas sp.]
MRTLVLIAVTAGLAACGPITFHSDPPAGPAPMDVALERQEDREAAEAERLRLCQMGETGVERDDRRCRDGAPR